MADPTTIAGILLVAGPIIGMIPVALPPFPFIWSMGREDHVSTVAAHRRGWWMLNVGFAFATIVTAGGLAVLAGAPAGDPGGSAWLTAVWVAYAIGGVLWCTVLAMRARTTPAIHDLGLVDSPPGTAEQLLGAATGGVFAMYVVVTAAALVVLGVVLAVAGGVAVPVAGIAAFIAVIAVGVQLLTGDTIPAVLYLPTLIVGIALLAGWT
jgi:hypothetical protein